MSMMAFLRDLVALLVRSDRNMLEFEEPLPDGVQEGLMAAVAAFGEQAVPVLHEALREAGLRDEDPIHVIELLGRIGSVTSVPVLIAAHDHGPRDFMTGFAMIAALRRLHSEQAYEYLAGLVERYAAGDHSVISSTAELELACRAMGDWPTERAVQVLKLALAIEPDYPILHAVAREQLVRRGEQAIDTPADGGGNKR